MRFGAEKRRERAEALKAAAASRTPEEQIARLDEKLGVGQGAKRERARLALKISAALKTKKLKKSKT